MNASAPGKLFLMGEYAVLEGTPAILTPVPQRAEVSLTINENGSSQDGTVTTIDQQVRHFSIQEALSTLPLLKAVVETLDCAKALKGKNLTLDTNHFFRDGIKLGLGSSAALTAALVKLFNPNPAITENELIELAQQCHRNFQDGRGSGADIALSVADKSIVHERGKPTQPITLPSELHMLAIWTGQAASTTQYLIKMEQWRDLNESAYQDHMAQLDETARDAVNSVHEDRAEHLLAGIAQYDRQLEKLSLASNLNFYNQTHLEMRKRVELADCAYKPSGAGGGDFGIAYCVCDQAENKTGKNTLNELAEALKREDRHCIFLGGDTKPVQQ